MKFKRLNSQRTVNVNVAKYAIKWDGKSASKFQKGVKDFLRPYWQSYICLEEFPVPGSRLRCDLINLSLKIMVEVNGQQHEEFNPFFHNESRLSYLGQIKRDVAKITWGEQNGFKYIEIQPKDLPLTKEFFNKQGIIL